MPYKVQIDKSFKEILENEDNYKTLDVIKSIWASFKKKRKIQMSFILSFIFLTSLLEILLLLVLIPLISLISNSNGLNNNFIIRNLMDKNGFDDPTNLILPLTIILGLVIVLVTLSRIINLWLINRISALIGVDLSTNCFRLSLSQSYEKHLKTNTSESIASLRIYINKTIIVIRSCLLMVGSFFTSLAIISTLLGLNFLATLYSIGFISLCYVILSKSLFRTLKNIGKIGAALGVLQIKNLQESLASIRDIILKDTHNIYIDNYSKIERKHRILMAKAIFLSGSPKFLIEGIALLAVCFLTSFNIILYKDSENFLPFLGAFILGIQRLLPSLQRIYQALAKIKSSSAEVERILNILELKNERHSYSSSIEKLFFRKKINLRKVCFKYNPSSEIVLKDINLTILKGERIGIIGKTGSGKSTLLDIFMTLISPTSGEILVDNINILSNKNYIPSWRSLISHVPQTVFLLDATIEENIALVNKTENIDRDLLLKCIEIAQLKELVDKSSKGIKTFIGERGVLLSGGEIQRIGIARALYGKAEILIFDEATSALDKYTEELIMNSINKLDPDLTIISVAHRLNTLSKCNSIYKIQNNNLIKVD